MSPLLSALKGFDNVLVARGNVSHTPADSCCVETIVTDNKAPDNKPRRRNTKFKAKPQPQLDREALLNKIFDDNKNTFDAPAR
ncbi:hypothetical protein [Sphingobium mellinum]|uniref:hypothetical protein n=1 Tax=Sphingobium mellinum TaxID=1387166 RepID=UPI0030ECA232